MQEEITNLLNEKYPNNHKLNVKVEGTDCGGYGVEVLIVTEDFTGKKLLDRHREIQKLIDFKEVHKVSLKTLTKEEALKKGFM